MVENLDSPEEGADPLPRPPLPRERSDDCPRGPPRVLLRPSNILSSCDVVHEEEALFQVRGQILILSLFLSEA